MNIVLKPHPFFEVKSPEFYRQKKLEYELNRQKYRLINQIRRGQEQDVLNQTIRSIRNKQQALNEIEREKKSLEFSFNPNDPKVTEIDEPKKPKEVKREEKEPEEKEPEKVEGSLRYEEMTGSQLTQQFKNAYSDLARDVGALSVMSKLSINQKTDLMNRLEGLEPDEVREILEETKASIKTSRPRPRPRSKMPGISMEELLSGRSKLSRGNPTTQREKSGVPEDPFLQELKQRQKKGLKSTTRRGARKKSLSNQEKLLQEVAEARSRLKSRGVTGKGISKQQKRQLMVGSMMAGNTNKELVKKILAI